MNVSLTPELEELVQQKVRSGMYSSASEVIRQALRLLREQDQLQQIRLAELRKEIQHGIDQLDRGEYVEITSDEQLDALVQDIVTRGRERLARRKRESA